LFLEKLSGCFTLVLDFSLRSFRKPAESLQAALAPASGQTFPTVIPIPDKLCYCPFRLKQPCLTGPHHMRFFICHESD